MCAALPQGSDPVPARVRIMTAETDSGEVTCMAAKEGYCVKCKAKKEIQDAQEITMKNGRPATQGLCPDCGTKIFKIGK